MAYVGLGMHTRKTNNMAIELFSEHTLLIIKSLPSLLRVMLSRNCFHEC